MTGIPQTDDVLLVKRQFRDDLFAALCSRGWHTLEFAGGASGFSFFRAAKEFLPMDPPLCGDVGWDSFSDSLGGGLCAFDKGPIAVIWNDADKMLQGDPASFESAITILADVGNALKMDRGRNNTSIVARFFLLGSDADFLSFDSRTAIV